MNYEQLISRLPIALLALAFCTSFAWVFANLADMQLRGPLARRLRGSLGWLYAVVLPFGLCGLSYLVPNMSERMLKTLLTAGALILGVGIVALLFYLLMIKDWTQGQK